jgi:hypothetical protein
VIVMTVNGKHKPLRVAAVLLLLMVLITGIAEWRFSVSKCIPAGGTCRALPIESKDDLVTRLKSILFQRLLLEVWAVDGNDPIFHLTDLEYLYQRSLETRPFVKEILVDPQIDTDVKRLAVRVSQCLPLADYLDFLAQVYADWKAGRVSAEILGTAVNPWHTWAVQLDEAFADPRVRNLLGVIAADPSVDAGTRNTINEYILSGVSAEHLLGISAKYHPMGETYPRIDCKPPGE